MKIVKLHIENFGKLSNFDLSFSSGLNQFIHENGWGKSTLCAFIKAMFYGLEAKGRKKDYQSERSKYEPWQGGKFGGNMTIEARGKSYQIFRTFGKTPEEDSFQLFDLNANKISGDYSENIGEELFGVGKETFAISAFFGQNDLSSSSTDEVVSNLAGIEKYKNDGEKTEFAIKLLEKNRKELVSLLPKEVELKQIERNIERLKKDISEAEQLLKNETADLQKQTFEKQEFDKIFEEEREKAKEQRKLADEKRALQEQFNSKNLRLNELANQKPIEKTKPKFLPLSILLFSVGAIFVLLFAFDVLAIEIGLTVGAIFLLLGGVLLIFKNKPRDTFANEEIMALRGEIDKLKVEIEALPEAEEIDSEALYQKKLEIEQGYAHASAKVANLTSEIESKQEELSILLTNESELEAERKGGLEKIELLKKTMNFLKMARENVSERFVTPLNEKFQSFFDGFNGSEKVSIDSSLNPWIITSQGAKNVEYLSQGYRDLVVICQRFSLLDKVYKKEKPCVILDDSFVNLDDQNFVIAKPILEELAKQYQVTYFSCSESRKIK